MLNEQHYLGLIRQKDEEIRSLQKQLNIAEQKKNGLEKTKAATVDLNKALALSESSWRGLAEKRFSELRELEKEVNRLRHEVNSKNNIIQGWESQFVAMKQSQEALQLALAELEKDRDSWKAVSLTATPRF